MLNHAALEPELILNEAAILFWNPMKSFACMSLSNPRDGLEYTVTFEHPCWHLLHLQTQPS